MPVRSLRVAAVPRCLIISVCGAFAGCAAHAPAAPAPAPPPPYASATPIATPRLFGPGMISTAAPEFGLTFEPDGRTAYFNRASDDRKQLTIWVARWSDGGWTAEVAPFSGVDRDLDPFVTPDGKRLYFSSERPRPGRPAPAGEPEPHLWYVERTGATWSAPLPVAGPVGELPTNFVSLTRDGTLYFGSFKDNVARMYRAAASGSTFGSPELIELDAETPMRNGNPLISPDERFLVFYSRPDQPGTEPDLYVTHPRAGGGWTRPRNLGPVINTAYTEFAPGLSPDGRYLFFTSERPGIVPALPALPSGPQRAPGDIYQLELAALPIAEPTAP
jgi:Tol biopolymer transport system component